MGMSMTMSRGKIIFMYGIGYMPNVQRISSCVICRKVKKWIFLWGTLRM